MDRAGPRPNHAASWTIGLMTASIVSSEVGFASVRSAAVRAVPELPCAFVAERARMLRPHLRAMGLRRPRLAVPDIGGLALTLREAEVIDTGRLADLALARHWNHATAVKDYLLSEGLPDYLDTHGPSTEIAGLSDVLTHYVRLATIAPEMASLDSVYVLAGLTASDDPRCPGSRSEVLALSAKQLETRVEAAMDRGLATEALGLWRCARAYQAEGDLPDAAWQERTASRAEGLSDHWLALGNVELALRYESLATVLSGGDPRRRHRTEALRERVF
jgi:hypothetical protein